MLGIDSVEIIPVSDPVVEAHHRIANNLAIIAGLIRSELLKLATKAQPNAGHTRRLLQQMSLRIDAVGRLHRLLMNTAHGGTVELCTYLREIVDAVTCSLTDAEHTKIVCSFGDQATVSAKNAAAIGLFVGEALVNSIKHAHPMDESGTIWINCKRAATASLLVEIIDNGAGTSLDFDADAPQTIGSGARLMRGIAHDLGAARTAANIGLKSYALCASSGMIGRPASSSATARLPSHLLKNVDLGRAGKQIAPGLQINLHARIAGDALAA